MSGNHAPATLGRELGERILARLPKRLREIPADLVVPILGAFGFVFVLNAVVSTLATGAFNPFSVVAQLVGSAFLFVLSLLVGRYLGRSLWPKQGSSLSRRLLESYAKNPERGDLVITGRPEFRARRAKRIYEVTALVAGLLVLHVVVVASLLPLAAALLFIPALVGAVWLTVMFVPHWGFALLGLRRVDRARFLVTPLTRDYSDRLRISNGAILLLVLGVGGFALRQTGRTDAQAAIAIAQVALSLVPGAVILAASAVAYYQRREPDVLERMARDAIALGYYDARGENESEILHNLRPRAAPRPLPEALGGPRDAGAAGAAGVPGAAGAPQRPPE